MSRSTRNILKEEFKKLRKALEKWAGNGKKPVPQLVLQPVRNKRY